MVATAIERDLRSWSQEVLEVPSPHLKGMPPCPYARKAWRDNKVLVIESDNFAVDVARYCRNFYELNKELVVIGTYDIPDSDALSELVDVLHADHPSLHCMQFHPDYGADDAGLDFLTDNDWESATDHEYCMVFIQDLALVVAASDRLEPLGYYAAYPHDEYEALVANRKRRLSYGYETSGDEARRREEDDARRDREQTGRHEGRWQDEDGRKGRQKGSRVCC